MFTVAPFFLESISGRIVCVIIKTNRQLTFRILQNMSCSVLRDSVFPEICLSKLHSVHFSVASCRAYSLPMPSVQPVTTTQLPHLFRKLVFALWWEERTLGPLEKHNRAVSRRRIKLLSIQLPQRRVAQALVIPFYNLTWFVSRKSDVYSISSLQINRSHICYYNPNQKSLATLRRKTSPASPLSMLLQWCRLFFRYFFEPAKQHWAGGMGEMEATVKYVVSFYVMWISTLLQSHVRAPPVQRWRCTILNKIITAATAVKLHGNRCSLNHVDMNL